MLICLYSGGPRVVYWVYMAIDVAEFSLTPETSAIVSVALTDIELIHGRKPYHNLDHALSVMRWSNAMAAYLHLPDDERSLIVTAAAFHDYVHNNAQGDEAASVEYLSGHMEVSRKFGRAAIESVTSMILGTVIEKVDGVLVQSAARSEHLGTRILADADLSGLGSPFEYLLASTYSLHEERSPGADERGPEMHKLLGEAEQLMSREPLTEAGQLFLPHRRENRERVLQMRAELGEELGLAA